jgi:Zn-finger nucleic acid-binding protein
MKCPVCKGTELDMMDRQGIEIDYCPECRGVWLDRGELDKIIERSAPASPGRENRPPSEHERQSREQRERRDFDDRDPRRRRRGGFLSELFD